MEIHKSKGQTMLAEDVRRGVRELRVTALLIIGADAEGIENDGDPLLDELASLDALIDVAKRVRLAVLRYERMLGTSWGEIEKATGTHASTWRFRHDRGVLGA